MFEKEEEKLNELRKQMEHVETPHKEIDGAILQGMERAKREKQIRRTKRKNGLWTLAVSAIVLITLVTSIRVSPAFANAVGSIPGMEKIVSLIQFDKGVTAAIENDYYQVIGVAQTKDQITLTIDGVILDESGMNIFYTLNSPHSLEKVELKRFTLENKEEIPPSSFSYGHMNDGEDVNVYSDRIDYHFPEPITFKDLSFTFNLNLGLNGKDTEFSLPFEIPENVKPSITHNLNQVVEIENQKFTIQEVTIHPLRVGVKISFDPTNSMKILHFEDMRLEDENGEVWGSIANGTTGRSVSDTEKIYYLQSNYFEKPEELYLRINKLQALDKDESELVINIDNQKILNKPEAFDIRLSQASHSGIEIHLYGEDFPYGLFSEVTDANGAKIEISTSGFSDRENFNTHDVTFRDPINTSVVHLPLSYFPNYIIGETSIQIK